MEKQDKLRMPAVVTAPYTRRNLDEWSAYIMREYARTIQCGHAPNEAGRSARNKIEEWREDLEKCIKKTEEAANMVKVALDAPKDSEAYQWATMMLKSWFEAGSEVED